MFYLVKIWILSVHYFTNLLYPMYLLSTESKKKRVGGEEVRERRQSHTCNAGKWLYCRYV